MSENQWWQTEENDTVATHPKLWRPIADKINGFDLDPASGCEPTPIADAQYTEADDGLTQDWFGNIWLNPPFSDKEAWYRKLHREYEQENIDRAVALGNAGTDTDWYQKYFSQADLICFLDGRDWYVQDGTENFATILGIWNPTEELRDHLNSIGTVVEPVADNSQEKLERWQ